MKGRGTTRRWATLALASVLFGCGPIASEETPPDAAAPPPGDPFIAFQRDFQGFEGWARIGLAAVGPVGEGLVHTAGQRTVYVNHLPAKGRTSFSNGTIVIKAMATGETFVQVKRGGDYNRSGAVGWEWFELKAVNGEWVIVWRGIAPPVGACMTNYGGSAMGGACNDCHVGFAANDFVGPNVFALEQP